MALAASRKAALAGRPSALPQQPACRVAARKAAPRHTCVARAAAVEPEAVVGSSQEGPVVMVSPVDMMPEMSVADLKAALLDSLYGTERGLTARSEVRAEVNELITQLEAANPTPSPAEAVEMLGGAWKLVYTSNSELMALLALSRLPFVTVGDITQKIDTATMSVENKVQLSVPLSRTSFSTSAAFEVRSPKRLQVRFEKGTIATPQLLSEIELPDSVSVMGQALDLSQLRTALAPINSGLKGIIDSVSNLLGQAPDLQFPLQGGQATTWLLTTFLDDNTRITRGDGGSVFILVKDVSVAA